ncbi:MAG: restriction endonuclease subunit S [Clostridiales bacterium]|jgi:type I restriction enzyme S subunit|nr:restriction endonuclease subunit S [Clostridiales bacterium]
MTGEKLRSSVLVELLGNDYPIKKLGEIVDFDLGKTPPRHEMQYWIDGSYSWVSIADMVENGVVESTKEKVSEIAYTQIFNKKLIPKVTLIMSFKLTIGRVSILGLDAFHNEAVISIYPHKEVLQDFLFIFLPLLTKSGKKKDAIKGATLNSKSLKDLQIPLPPLAEQAHMVERFKALEPLIAEYAKLEREREYNDVNLPSQLKKSILQSAITGELTNADISKWKECKLGEIAEVKGGKRLPAGRQLSIEKTEKIYIRITDMGNQTISNANLRYVPQDIIPLIKNYTISKDDLYLTIAGSIGQVGVIPNEFDNMNLTENAVKLTNIKADKEYLLIALRAGQIQEQFNEFTNKVGQPKLAIKRIEQVIIPLPPLDEQKRVVVKVKEYEILIDNLTKNVNGKTI